LNEESIFHQAREKSPSERAAFLDSTCAGDVSLRRRVEVLLKAHENTGNFLDRPVLEKMSVEAISTLNRALGDQATAGSRSQPPGSSGEPSDPFGDEEELNLDFLKPAHTPGGLGRLGHYEVLAVVGRGGMGTVLKAFDDDLQRVVAIKVMASHLSAQPGARRRFEREARAVAAVRNDHVVAVYAVEPAGPTPYLVMEFIAGKSLQERVDQGGPLELKEILRIGHQTACGLAAAHAQGLVHRDVKPANILLENGVERVKLTDFGLARAVADANLTQAGKLIGTPNFMSPEQALGLAVDHRSDLFSLGTVLYFMCTGRPPFQAGGTMAVLKRICEDTPRPVHEADPTLPDWLSDIIACLQAKEPAQRFQSAAEVAELLGQYLASLQQPGSGLPTVLRPTKPVLASASKMPTELRSRLGLWRGLMVALLVALAGVSILYAPTIYRLSTNQGQLIIETDDPDVAVIVKQDDQTAKIVDKKSGRTVLLKAGTYQLELGESDQSLMLSTNQFTLQRDGKEIVKVRLGPPVITEVRWFQGAPEGATYTAALCLGDKSVLTAGGSLFKDGNWAQGTDFALRLWDRATGKELARLPSHQGPVLCLGISPDGKRAVSGGSSENNIDCAVRVWDLENRKELRRFTKHTGRVISAAFLPSGKQVISVGGNFAGVGAEVWLWDVETGEEVRQFKGHTHEVRWVAVLPDGKRFITSGQDGLAFLWDVAMGKSVRPLASGEGGGGGTLTRDGRYVALTWSDSTIRLLDVETGAEVRRFTGHKGWAGSLAFSPEGRRLLAGSEGKTIHLWDVATGKEVCQFDGDFQGPTGVAGITADGKEALVNCWDGSLRLLRMPPVPIAKKK
jgi:serine/threonine protein kinase